VAAGNSVKGSGFDRRVFQKRNLGISVGPVSVSRRNRGRDSLTSKKRRSRKNQIAGEHVRKDVNGHHDGDPKLFGVFNVALDVAEAGLEKLEVLACGSKGGKKEGVSTALGLLETSVSSFSLGAKKKKTSFSLPPLCTPWQAARRV
jgi:hypothetical protein